MTCEFDIAAAHDSFKVRFNPGCSKQLRRPRGAKVERRIGFSRAARSSWVLAVSQGAAAAPARAGLRARSGTIRTACETGRLQSWDVPESGLNPFFQAGAADSVISGFQTRSGVPVRSDMSSASRESRSGGEQQAAAPPSAAGFGRWKQACRSISCPWCGTAAGRVLSQGWHSGREMRRRRQSFAFRVR